MGRSRATTSDFRAVCSAHVATIPAPVKRFTGATIFSLTWLAQQMEQRHLTEFHLESLQADWLRTRLTRITYMTIFGWVIWPIARLSFGLIFDLIAGPVVGLSFGLTYNLSLLPVFGLGFSLVNRPGFGLVGEQVRAQLSKQVDKLENIKPVEKFFWTREGLAVGLIFG